MFIVYACEPDSHTKKHVLCKRNLYILKLLQTYVSVICKSLNYCKPDKLTNKHVLCKHPKLLQTYVSVISSLNYCKPDKLTNKHIKNTTRLF